MKKSLLTLNVVLYAILYNASLLYTGYRYGELADNLYYSAGPKYFIFPAFYLILLGVGIYQLGSRELDKARSYIITAVVTLAFVLLFWGNPHSWKINIGASQVYTLYFVVLLVGSVLISLIYFICAAITRKEDKVLRNEINRN